MLYSSRRLPSSEALQGTAKSFRDSATSIIGSSRPRPSPIEMSTTAAAAASLLEWLDSSSPEPVMQSVHRWVEQQEDRPMPLQVDVTALICDDVQLALAVMQDTRSLSAQVEGLINQQLAVAAAEPAAVSTTLDMAELPEPPRIRAHIQMTADAMLLQVPLPLQSPSEVQHHVVQLSSSSSSSSMQTAPSAGLGLASVLAVVTGLSAPGQRVHSQRFACPACSTVVDVPVRLHSLPCCNFPKTGSLQEDVTGRVMVACQELWVADLGAASRAEFGCSLQPLLVVLPEEAVGGSVAALGAVVHVIGHASLQSSSGAACSIQMHANNIQLQLPHLLWSLPPASLGSITEQQRQQPLQLLWDLLGCALGYGATIDPHMALVLLLSAACVGSTETNGQQRTSASEVHLLLLHEGCSSATLRLMRQAAALLSPQSVALPVPLAEHVLPITAAGAGTADEQPGNKPLFASLLHLANTGVAVADLATLPSKPRQQLLEALQQRRTGVPAGLAAAAGATLPLTATCWAAACWSELGADLGAFDAVHVKPSKASAATAARSNFQGFDLVIAENTVHEQDLFALLGPSASSSGPGQQQQQQQLEAEAVLRYLLGEAALNGSPVLTDAAQAFLGKYFLLLRQSLGSSSKLSKPALLAGLVRISAGVARLHQRSSVLECPDAAVAVLLVEQSLANRLGSGYASLLELPADLQPTNNRTLDEQVALLHSIMRQTLDHHCRGSADEGDDGSGAGGGWYADAGEGSDCGSAGGVGC